MARSKRVPDEKPLFWIGSAKSDLLDFPEAVKNEIGVAFKRCAVWWKASERKAVEGRGGRAF
jgi:phage-related protein